MGAIIVVLILVMFVFAHFEKNRKLHLIGYGIFLVLIGLLLLNMIFKWVGH